MYFYSSREKILSFCVFPVLVHINIRKMFQKRKGIRDRDVETDILIEIQDSYPNANFANVSQLLTHFASTFRSTKWACPLYGEFSLYEMRNRRKNSDV